MAGCPLCAALPLGAPTFAAAMVDDQNAPNLVQLARQGVHLRNGHSLCPTFATANASVMATGHCFGDTGHYCRRAWSSCAAWPVRSAASSISICTRPAAARRSASACSSPPTAIAANLEAVGIETAQAGRPSMRGSSEFSTRRRAAPDGTPFCVCASGC